MNIKLDASTRASLEKTARERGKTPEELAEELLIKKYKFGITDTRYATIYDASVTGWQAHFDSDRENRSDMVITVRMSDQAAVVLTNAARQAKSTPEALVLKLIEEKWGSKSDSASDPNLVRQAERDILTIKENNAREQYIERLKSKARR